MTIRGHQKLRHTVSFYHGTHSTTVLIYLKTKEQNGFGAIRPVLSLVFHPVPSYDMEDPEDSPRQTSSMSVTSICLTRTYVGTSKFGQAYMSNQA
jgi:hypothetical protein